MANDVFGEARRLLEGLKEAREHGVQLNLHKKQVSKPPCRFQPEAADVLPVQDARKSPHGIPWKAVGGAYASPPASKPRGSVSPSPPKRASPQTWSGGVPRSSPTRADNLTGTDLLRVSRNLLEDVREGQNRWQLLSQRTLGPDQAKERSPSPLPQLSGAWRNTLPEGGLLSAANVGLSRPEAVGLSATSPLQPAAVIPVYGAQGGGTTATHTATSLMLSPAAGGVSTGSADIAQRRYQHALAALRQAEQQLSVTSQGTTKPGQQLLGVTSHLNADVYSGSLSATACSMAPVPLPAFMLAPRSTQAGTEYGSSPGPHTAADGGAWSLSPATQQTLTLEAEAAALLRRLAAAPATQLHAAAAARPAALAAAAAAEPASRLELQVAMAQVLSGARAARQQEDEQARWQSDGDSYGHEPTQEPPQQHAATGDGDGGQGEWTEGGLFTARLLQGRLLLRLWRLKAHSMAARRADVVREVRACRMHAVVMAWHGAAAAGREARVAAAHARDQEETEEQCKAMVAVRFWRLRLAHVTMSAWHNAACKGHAERMQSKAQQRKLVAEEQEEQVHLTVACRFRSLWLLHSHFTLWRRTAAALAQTKRLCNGPMDQARRAKVQAFMGKLAAAQTSAPAGPSSGPGFSPSSNLPAGPNHAPHDGDCQAGCMHDTGNLSSSYSSRLENPEWLLGRQEALQRLQARRHSIRGQAGPEHAGPTLAAAGRASAHALSLPQGAQQTQAEGNRGEHVHHVQQQQQQGSRAVRCLQLELSQASCHSGASGASWASGSSNTYASTGPASDMAPLQSAPSTSSMHGQQQAGRISGQGPSTSAKHAGTSQMAVTGSVGTNSVTNHGVHAQHVHAVNVNLTAAAANKRSVSTGRMPSPGLRQGSTASASPGMHTVPQPFQLSTSARAVRKRQQCLASAEGTKDLPSAQPGAWSRRSVRQGLAAPPGWGQMHGQQGSILDSDVGHMTVTVGVPAVPHAGPVQAEGHSTPGHTSAAQTAAPAGAGAHDEIPSKASEGHTSEEEEGSCHDELSHPVSREFLAHADRQAQQRHAAHAEQGERQASQLAARQLQAGGSTSAADHLHSSCSVQAAAVPSTRHPMAMVNSSVPDDQSSCMAQGASKGPSCASSQASLGTGSATSAMHSRSVSRDRGKLASVDAAAAAAGCRVQGSQRPMGPMGPPSYADLSHLRAVEVRRARDAADAARRVAEELASSAWALAGMHYTRSLLHRCGLGPWLALASEAQAHRCMAMQAWHTRMLRSGLVGLARGPVRRRWRMAGRQAAAVGHGRTMHQMHIMRTALGRLAAWAQACRVHARSLARRSLAGMLRAVTYAWATHADAETHWHSRLARRCLQEWRRAAEQQADAALLHELQRVHDAQQALWRPRLARALHAWHEDAAQSAKQRVALQARSETMTKVSGWLDEFRAQRKQQQGGDQRQDSQRVREGSVHGPRRHTLLDLDGDVEEEVIPETATSYAASQHPACSTPPKSSSREGELDAGGIVHAWAWVHSSPSRQASPVSVQDAVKDAALPIVNKTGLSTANGAEYLEVGSLPSAIGVAGAATGGSHADGCRLPIPPRWAYNVPLLSPLEDDLAAVSLRMTAGSQAAAGYSTHTHAHGGQRDRHAHGNASGARADPEHAVPCSHVLHGYGASAQTAGMIRPDVAKDQAARARAFVTSRISHTGFS